MKTLKIRQVLKDSLNASKGNLHIISKETGVPYFTIMGFMQGKTSNMKLDTLQPLLDYFKYRLVKEED